MEELPIEGNTIVKNMEVGMSDTIQRKGIGLLWVTEEMLGEEKTEYVGEANYFVPFFILISVLNIIG